MHEAFIRRAILLAVENVEQGRGGPFGAVVVKDGAILAEGVNLVTIAHDPTAHAEVMAIREACRTLRAFELRGCILYASCEPCPMCLSAIHWSRLDALFYAASRHDAAAAGFDDALLYEQIPLPVSQRALATRQLADPEATRPFQLWHDSPARVPY